MVLDRMHIKKGKRQVKYQPTENPNNIREFETLYFIINYQLHHQRPYLIDYQKRKT